MGYKETIFYLVSSLQRAALQQKEKKKRKCLQPKLVTVLLNFLDGCNPAFPFFFVSLCALCGVAARVVRVVACVCDVSAMAVYVCAVRVG